MRVIFPKSIKKREHFARALQEKDSLWDTNGVTITSHRSIVQVKDAVCWSELDLRAAQSHLVPFLYKMKNDSDRGQAVPLNRTMLDALDFERGFDGKIFQTLRQFGTLYTLIDILALAGPAVEYAVDLWRDKSQRTPENIEKFVISLILALAEASGDSDYEILPLDNDMMAGITVTVRNILRAYNKDFEKIELDKQIGCFATLVSKFRRRRSSN